MEIMVSKLAPIPGRLSLAVLISFALWPSVTPAQQEVEDFENFRCRDIRRVDDRMEALRPGTDGPTSTVYTCYRQTCVTRQAEVDSEGREIVAYMQVVFPYASTSYLMSRTEWVGDETEPRIRSGEVPFVGCDEVSIDPDRWTIDIGDVVETDGVVLATPLSDNRPSYVHAPSSYHGDWTGFTIVRFDKRSIGGGYLRAYFSNISGDVVLENGLLRASHEIPQHHDGAWYSYEVPLDSPGWNFRGGAEAMADVLENVTGFQIRAEYGDGADETSIRNVRVE